MMGEKSPAARPNHFTPKNVLIGVLLLSTIYLLFQLSIRESSPAQILGRLASENAIVTGLDSTVLQHGIDARLVWGKGAIPQTQLLRHAPGWTAFDNLYTLNGTLYIVSDSPQNFPEIRMMTSSGYMVFNPPEEVKKREPSDRDMKIISTREAKKLFGKFANRLDGVTFLNNDPDQFIRHYYHFAAELMFGFWRAYTSLDIRIKGDGITELPPPRRLMFVREDEWRDYASMNQYIVDGAFPSMAVETSRDWDDRASTLSPYVFDRVILGDRAAAMRGPEFVATSRTASETFLLPGSRDWWSPVRANLLEFVGLNRTTGGGTRGRPVITYVSRQDWGRRKLIDADHDGLVAALKELEAKYGYELNIVSMDKITREEQLKLAGRTTVMLGVHGNGLTHLLWMNPTPRATVIEFFFPGGFAYDYEWTTRALGMIHYGFWGSDFFTSPKLPPVGYPEGFQGNSIPIDGKKVAEIIQWRLSLAEEADD